MKKVLIMTASTGGGHNRAAKAICDEITKKQINGYNIECKIIDSFKLVNQTMDKIISEGYEMSAKYTPSAYGKVYSLSDKKIFSHNEFKSNPLSLIMSRKFKKLIKEEKPDLIIGTHAFPLVALSRLKKAYSGTDLDEELYELIENDQEEIFNFPPLVSVLTDYTAHSTYLQNEIDYYICGDDFVRELLIEDGIPKDKIKPFGIPVEKSFLEHKPREEVLTDLKLDPNKKTVLLMGGSFGAGNISGSLEELMEIERDFQVIVVAGRNRSLKLSLRKKVKSFNLNNNSNIKIKVLGFSKQMNNILSASDILITKPGGLTSTEALLKEIPMVIPYFIPGQEEENLDFLTNCGVAIRTTKKFTLKSVIKVLLDQPERLDRMRENIRLIKKVDAAEKIAELSFDIFNNTKVDYSHTFNKNALITLSEITAIAKITKLVKSHI